MTMTLFKIKTIAAYQATATKTMKKHSNPEVAALYFSGALCGEAGEAFEIVKKAIRDETPINHDKLQKELGDVLWYLAAICELHGYRLQDVANLNLEKLASRHPQGTFQKLCPECKKPLLPVPRNAALLSCFNPECHFRYRE